MLEFKKITKEEDFDESLTREKYIDFLYEHLKPFGDEKSAISKCIDFAFGKGDGLGGFLLAAYEDGKLAGELVMNYTGMEEFIPENILVYIAVDSQFRNRGIGRQIVEEAAKHTKGNIKLHVEYDNPAKRLYERIGFNSKYAEMRWNRSE